MKQSKEWPAGFASMYNARKQTRLPGARELWILATGVVLLVLLLSWFAPQYWHLLRDEAALEAWIAQLGWLGPVALVFLNALQIIVAPIPGYVVQLAAGFLYGAWWGGLWGSLGLLLGASVAFWLSRRYGRPFAAWLVGGQRLDRWESVTHSTNTLVWFVLLVGITGDLPYYLAGLSRVSFAKILVITLIVRIPSTFVAAAVGAGIVVLTWWQLLLLFGCLFMLVIVFMRYQDAILDWADGLMLRRLGRGLDGEHGQEAGGEAEPESGPREKPDRSKPAPPQRI